MYGKVLFWGVFSQQLHFSASASACSFPNRAFYHSFARMSFLIGYS